jgi:hypothetical protein
MKNRNFVFLSLLVMAGILLYSCASAPSSRSNVPPEITLWMNENSNEVFSGMGISTHAREDDAYQQAITIARENLAAALETEVAAISEDYRKILEGRGEFNRIAEFGNSTKQRVAQLVRNTKTYGPFINNNGATYILLYMDKKSTQPALETFVEDTFADTKNELNEILNS